MPKLVSLAAAVLLLSAPGAWAQSAGSTVPQVTTPQVTGTTTQGTSDAAKAAAKPANDGKATPAPSKDDKDKDKDKKKN